MATPKTAPRGTKFAPKGGVGSAKRRTANPKEPTPEQIDAVLDFILHTNEPALRALAHR